MTVTGCLPLGMASKSSPFPEAVHEQNDRTRWKLRSDMLDGLS